MKTATILREAWHNIISGTTKIGRYFIVLLLVLSAGLVLDLSAVNQSLEKAYTFRDSGAAVYIYTARDAIDPAACEALATIDGVNAAGALRDPQKQTSFTALPGNPVPRYEITSGVGEILSDTEIETGVLLSPQAAEPLHAAAGDELPTSSSSLIVADVYDYPVDGRRTDFDFATLELKPATHNFDECWLDVWPVPHHAIDYLSFAHSITADSNSDDDSGAVVTQLNSAKGTELSAPTDFSTRPTRFMPYAVGGIATVIALFAVRSRRLENASALHSGVHKRELRLQMVAETLIWSVPAILCSLATTLYFVVGVEPQDRAALWHVGGLTALCALTGTVIGAIIAVATTKEEQLFNYFKAR